MDDFDEEKFELQKKLSVTGIILRDENIFNMILPFIDNVIEFDFPHIDKVEDVEKTNINDFKKAIKNLDFSNYIVTVIKEKNNSI